MKLSNLSPHIHPDCYLHHLFYRLHLTLSPIPPCHRHPPPPYSVLNQSCPHQNHTVDHYHLKEIPITWTTATLTIITITNRQEDSRPLMTITPPYPIDRLSHPPQCVTQTIHLHHLLTILTTPITLSRNQNTTRLCHQPSLHHPNHPTSRSYTRQVTRNERSILP